MELGCRYAAGDNMCRWWILVCLLHLSPAVSGSVGSVDTPCSDHAGEVVSEGMTFMPDPKDLCKVCRCENGFSINCETEVCATHSPDCRFWETEPVDGQCCPVVNCIELPEEGDSGNVTKPLNPDDNATGLSADTTNLGLRLVASFVTSFLILALLLFMIHRLRQRRMLVMMRRMSTERHGEDDTVAYMSQFDHVDIGITFPPYEDPPPPYSSPKPPRVRPGEAPPPYTEHAGDAPGDGSLVPALAASTSPQTPDSTGGASTLPRSAGQTPVTPMSPQCPANHDENLMGNTTTGESSQDCMNQSTCCTSTTEALCLSSSTTGAVPLTGTSVGLSPQSPCSLDSYPQHDSQMSLKQTKGGEPMKKQAMSSQMGSTGDMGSADQTASSQVVSGCLRPDHSLVHVNSGSAPSVCTGACGSGAAHTATHCHLASHVTPGRPMSECFGVVPSDSGVHSQLLVPALQQQLAAHAALFPSHKSPPRNQYIKRSGSVEIRRGSSSPRNSYIDPESEHNANNCDRAKSAIHRASTDARLTSEQRGDTTDKPNATSSSRSIWVPQNNRMGVKIRGFPNRAEALANVDVDKEEKCGTRGGDVLCCLNGQCCDGGGGVDHVRPRPSILPLNLTRPNSELLQGMGARTLQQDVQHAQDIAAERDHMARATDSQRIHLSPDPTSSSTTSPSPQSPPMPPLPRSGSGLSQMSQFSVCSETGERGRPRGTGAISLRNDMQYPTVALSCVNPTSPHRGASAAPKSSGRQIANNLSDRRVTTPSNTAEGRGMTASYKRQGATPIGQRLAEPLAHAAGMSPDARTYRKVIYRDPEDMYSGGEGPGRKSPEKTHHSPPKPTMRSIGVSCENDLAKKGDKVTMRKLKKKKVPTATLR